MLRKGHEGPLVFKTMQAMLANPRTTSSRLRVGVICHGEQLPPSFIDGLEREIIEPVPITSMSLDKGLDLQILLLWLSPGTPPRVLQAMASWTANQDRRVGLIGCCPSGDVEDTIAAFEAGADDFVAGRCGVRELASRIHALRQRLVQPSVPAGLSYAGLSLDAPSHEVTRGEQTIQLSSTEVAVLRVLLNSEGRTLSRHTILDRAWGEHHFDVGERAVDNVILRLRRKLGAPHIIETVRGVGFRLAPEQ